MGLLENRKRQKAWVENQIEIRRRLRDAYIKIMTQMDDFNENVRKARKDVFKDGLFKGDYDWKGDTFQAFQGYGNGDVNKEIENYYRNGASGLNDIADALNDKILEIDRTVRRTMGLNMPILDILEWLHNEIRNLTN